MLRILAQGIAPTQGQPQGIAPTQGQPQGIAPTNNDVGAIPCGCPMRRFRIT